MPAWRTASSRAASRGVRSGSRSPPSAVSARPMPTPASACGITVHHRLAPGSQASASTPPPTSAQPAAARVRGSPRRREPASAARGMTVTAAAALSGLTFQPATSSRTSRKSTAASAAETSASASAGRRAKRSGRSGSGGAGARDGPDEDSDRARRRHRDLEDEDRAPVERLGQRAADRRPQRGGEHRRAQPQAAPRAGAAEEVEDGGQPRRGADRLRAARDEQAGEVVGARARGAGHREEREAAGARSRGPTAPTPPARTGSARSRGPRCRRR